MRLDIKVIPNSKKNFISEETAPLKVHLTAPAVEGKANAALINFLAEHYGVRKNQVTIIKGLKSRLKTINIET